MRARFFWGDLSVSDSKKVWIGIDPGGREAFGVATLAADGAVRSWCVDSTDEAVEQVRKEMAEGDVLAGIGVDAPLWWSSSSSGRRLADEWLRQTYRLSGGEVQSINSLRGAVLAQGMLAVARLRVHFPAANVTETHPKALLKALGLTWPAFAERFGLQDLSNRATDHERDAAVSAVAAREGFEGRWTIDLSRRRGSSEDDPARHWLAPIHYHWPQT